MGGLANKEKWTAHEVRQRLEAGEGQMLAEISSFCAAGLSLVAIPPDNGKPTKAPRAKGWNQPRSINNPSGYSAIAIDFLNFEEINLGLYHGASNTLALDLDDVELARRVFEDTTELQLLDWLENNERVEIKSPKANRGKLLFKLPVGFDGAGLRQLKHGGNVVFELRSGNCQDVIYGQHPEGGNYQLIGNPAAIPEAPAVILDMLSHWADWKPCFDSALGAEQKPPPIAHPKVQQSPNIPGQRCPISEFNQANRAQSVLMANGYKPVGKDRFLRPNSKSKAPGAVIMRNCSDGIERVYSHGGDTLNDGHAHDAFDCYRILECDGDLNTALGWSPDISKHNQRLYRQEQAKRKPKQTSETELLFPVIENNPEQLNQPISLIKQATINKLLNKVVRVAFKAVCLKLGWTLVHNQDGTEKPPLQKHYKVAIIDQLLQVAHANDWHLVRDSGMSYIYTGCMWLSLDKDELKNLLKDVAIRQGYPEIEARDSKFINALFDQALQDGFFADKYFERQSMINLSNCTLVLDSDGVITKPFDYRDFLTHQLPFNYQPQARNLIFEQYLNDVLPDKNTQRTLQEVCGYLFIKGLKLEKIFFLYGEGANGKSVLFEVINGLIGVENISHFSLESLTDDTGYFRAKIKDKIVNYGTDIRLNKIDAGMFKTLASGEPIEARLPYAEPFTMSDYAKLIFNVNRLDNANIEHTHGFYRRILIIPFEKTIADKDQDKSLHKKILSNKAGVLNWIIEGAERVIRNEDIFISDECKKFKDKFIKDTDTVALFAEARNYSNKGRAMTYLSSIYADYKDFCSEDGYSKPLGKNNFAKRFEALGYVRCKDSHNKDCFKIGDA
jgi:P4 family phage/plasmid primase-like protien